MGLLVLFHTGFLCLLSCWCSAVCCWRIQRHKHAHYKKKRKKRVGMKVGKQGKSRLMLFFPLIPQGWQKLGHILIDRVQLFFFWRITFKCVNTSRSTHYQSFVIFFKLSSKSDGRIYLVVCFVLTSPWRQKEPFPPLTGETPCPQKPLKGSPVKTLQ